MFRLNSGQIKQYPHSHLFQDTLNKNCHVSNRNDMVGDSSSEELFTMICKINSGC